VSLNLLGIREKQVAIDADYSAICKFESADSPVCELALIRLLQRLSAACRWLRTVSLSNPTFIILAISKRATSNIHQTTAPTIRQSMKMTINV
jgi:hypothetical protein